MIVPPIPLFAVFGKPDEQPATWSRRRVIFIDSEGTPWVVGSQPDRFGGEFYEGDGLLGPATSYSNYLGVSEASNAEEQRTTISASPGWRCAFGCRFEDGSYETWLSEVAAWSLSSCVELYPIVRNDDTFLSPADKLDIGNVRLLKIFEPGERVPEASELEKLARQAFPG